MASGDHALRRGMRFLVRNERSKIVLRVVSVGKKCKICVVNPRDFVLHGCLWETSCIGCRVLLATIIWSVTARAPIDLLLVMTPTMLTWSCRVLATLKRGVSLKKSETRKFEEPAHCKVCIRGDQRIRLACHQDRRGARILQRNKCLNICQ